MAKQLSIKGTILGADKPAVCSSIIGKNEMEINADIQAIVEKKPDFIEWRADFLEEIGKVDVVLALAKKINAAIKDIPLIFTIRSEREGGQKIPLDETKVVELLHKVSQSEIADIIDYELANSMENINKVREFTSKYNRKLLLSHHNFQITPSKSEMFKKLFYAEFLGADIAKLAVMPNQMKDVLALLEITNDAKDVMEIPIITISMGADGALTRISGWKFGSSLTFAVGSQSSAPGQVPVEAIKQMQNYMVE